MRVRRDRHSEIESLQTFLIYEGPCNCRVILSTADACQQSRPRQNFLSQVELRFSFHQLEQLIVQPGGLAVLNEFEGTVVILRRDHDRLTILDFLLKALRDC